MWPQFNSLLTAWEWVLLLAIPPAIIALYFLKLKRKPIEVPSTYLWHKSIEDLHVNSLWQRLRQNILLFLQLLVVLFIILSIARPFWRGTQLSGERFIFLVDNSASMASSDQQPTRLEHAKIRVAEHIDNMPAGSVAMIVSFASSARVEQTFTDNRAELKRRLASIKQTNESSSLLEALQVAAGLANPGRSAFDITDEAAAEALPADVYLFSDGRFEPPQFALQNLAPFFMPVGKRDAANVGIAAFSIRQNEEKPGEVQAYARLHNFGLQPATVEIGMYQDGTLVDAQRISIPADNEFQPEKPKDAPPSDDEPEPEPDNYRGVVFDLLGFDGGVLELRIETADALEADNTAWAVVNPPRPGRILVVSPGNEPLKLALSTGSSSRLADLTWMSVEDLKSEAYKKAALSGNFNLIIYDRCQPEKMPQSNTLLIGQLPKEGWKSEGEVKVPSIIDVNRSHPLMNLVKMDDVLILGGMANVEGPPGTRSLMDSQKGSMLAIAPREGFQDAVLAFPLVSSEEGWGTNWPTRASFPVFIYNLLRYLGGGEDPLATGSVFPGQPLSLRSPGVRERITVKTPSGREVKLRRSNRNTFEFNDTEELGVYEVHWSDQDVQRFAVNLFDRRESDVKRARVVKIGYEPVDAQANQEIAKKEIWKWLLLLAFGVLMFEWWIYNRRVYL